MNTTTEPKQHSSDLATWEKRFLQYLSSLEWDDGAHDLAHFQRVWGIAQKILAKENQGNPLVVLAGCYFHDIVSLPKDHPQRRQSSVLAGQKSGEILREMDFPKELIPLVIHAVEAHSFSAQIAPTTIEAKIVQDADRMEALGYIGIARVFYVGGQLKRPLFHPEDPLARHRPLNDQKYTLDHFQVKLLKLKDTLQTKGGQELAEVRSQILYEFMINMAKEVSI